MCWKTDLYVCLKIPQTCCMMVSQRLPCLLAPAPPTTTPSPSFSGVLLSQPPSPSPSSLGFSYWGHFAYFRCEKSVSSKGRAGDGLLQRDHSAETYRSTVKSGIPVYYNNSIPSKKEVPYREVFPILSSMSFYEEFLVSLGLEETKRRPRYESIFPIFKGISQEHGSYTWRNPDIESGSFQEMVLFFVEILQENTGATGQGGRTGGGGLGDGVVFSSRKERPSIKVPGS